MITRASYTGWEFTFLPGTTGEQSLVWKALLAIAYVSIAAVMAVRERTAWATHSPGDLVTELG